MNIIAWNCRGAQKAAFRSHVRELVRIHDPAILIVMETRVGGDRAKAITDDLPFDGAIHIDTMGYAGGLWLLWNGDRVQINQLAITEQEIHVGVKVLSSNLNWLLSESMLVLGVLKGRCYGVILKLWLTFMICHG